VSCGSAFPSGSRAGGFTLIEVVVASTLLVVGVLALLPLIDGGMRATTDSLRRDTANALARETIERAQSLRYDLVRNDLTDVGSTAPRTPAERLWAAMDPGAPADRAPVIEGTTTPIAAAAEPWRTSAAWQVERDGVPFTVTYRACTRSAVVAHVAILGPYDCERTTSAAAPPAGTATSGTCSLALANAPELTAPSPPNDLVARVQLLSLVGVRACVGGTLAALDLSALSGPLCTVLGDGAHALGTVEGLLDGVLGPLASEVALSVCPTVDGTPAPGFADGIAGSTDVTVTVSWTPPNGAAPAAIVERALVRRTGT